MPEPVGDPETGGSWLDDAQHRAFLAADVRRQLRFFRPSLRADGGFDVLDLDGRPLLRGPQELHTTTRLVHAFALAKAAGAADCDPVIDAGMDFLWTRHRDARHGGYLWSVGAEGAGVDRKLAYGHVFVLLAAASAREVGHPDADRLLADIAEVLQTRFWDDAAGLFREEFARDWSAFSDYRGMNANMHGVEALLAAFEATGEALYRDRAGRILGFFLDGMAPEHGWRLPEHYTADWRVDPGYAGDPMFRPAGTTPGHSVEMGRLALQHWDLCGRPAGGREAAARRLIGQALAEGWREDGGLVYTLRAGGGVLVADRYWWPVAEAIGATAALLKLAPAPEDEAWYRRLWQFAADRLVDAGRGGWFPELDEAGRPAGRQFVGKPDLYHSLQAALFPLVPQASRLFAALRRKPIL